MKYYNNQWDIPDQYMSKIERVCLKVYNYEEKKYNNLLLTTIFSAQNIQIKKYVIFTSTGYLSRCKKGVVSSLVKSTQLLYKLCNTECIMKFDFNIGQLLITNMNEL